MSEKNDRKDVYPIRKGLKAGVTDGVKNLLSREVLEIFRDNEHFNSKLIDLNELEFTKLFGKQITIFTKKQKYLPYHLQNSLLANAVDRRDKKNSKEFKKTVITLGISYQNTIDRIFILVVKTMLSRQKHKLLGYLETVKKELMERDGISVTKNGRNIVDHSNNLYVVDKLIEYYSQH